MVSYLVKEKWFSIMGLPFNVQYIVLTSPFDTGEIFLHQYLHYLSRRYDSPDGKYCLLCEKWFLAIGWRENILRSGWGEMVLDFGTTALCARNWSHITIKFRRNISPSISSLFIKENLFSYCVQQEMILALFTIAQ